ncbi:hypothetical protein RJ55_02906 [Drechmeria coniospora]|nr:hypothetical protein RJ55_02906 [Drechmeria coniospora]
MMTPTIELLPGPTRADADSDSLESGHGSPIPVRKCREPGAVQGQGRERWSDLQATEPRFCSRPCTSFHCPSSADAGIAPDGRADGRHTGYTAGTGGSPVSPHQLVAGYLRHLVWFSPVVTMPVLATDGIFRRRTGGGRRAKPNRPKRRRVTSGTEDQGGLSNEQTNGEGREDARRVKEARDRADLAKIPRICPRPARRRGLWRRRSRCHASHCVRMMDE